MDYNLQQYNDSELIERKDLLSSTICTIQNMINRQPDLSYTKKLLIEDKQDLQSEINAIDSEIDNRIKSI